MQNIDGQAVVVSQRGVARTGDRTRVSDGMLCGGTRTSFCVVPPVFADFDGRVWEKRYPELLDKYYSVLERISTKSLRNYGAGGLCENGVGDVNVGDAVGSPTVGEFIDRTSDNQVVVYCGGCDADVGEFCVGSKQSVGECTAGKVCDGVVGFSDGLQCGQCNSRRVLACGVERSDGNTQRTEVTTVSGLLNTSVPLGAVKGAGIDAAVSGAGIVKLDSSDSSVSAKTLVNREKRVKKKERKLRKQRQDNGAFGSVVQDDGVPEWRRGASSFGTFAGGKYRGAFSSCSEDVRRQLAETRAKRLIAENEACVRRVAAEVDGWEHVQKLKKDQRRLKVLQVGQQIELTRSRDLEKIKKRDEVRVLRETETSKVAVEKAFGTLAVTGNVSSFTGGSVETVLSSGSISPNSSISEAEVRKLQKDFADLEAEQLKVRKSNDALVSRIKEMQSCAERGDIEGVRAISKVDCQAMYEESVGVSLDEEGIPYGMLDEGGAGYFDSRGRFHFGDDGGAYHDYY